jgi:hypothetical protein
VFFDPDHRNAQPLQFARSALAAHTLSLATSLGFITAWQACGTPKGTAHGRCIIAAWRQCVMCAAVVCCRYWSS